MHRRLDTRLVAFNRQDAVASMSHHDGAGGRVLRVHRIEADKSAGQIESLAQCAGGRDLVGFFRTPLAAQKHWVGEVTALTTLRPTLWAGTLPSRTMSSLAGGAPST